MPFRYRGVEEPLLDRQQRHLPTHRALVDLQTALALLRHRGQPLHRLVLEQVLGGEADTGLPGPADHLDRDDRVATQLEEVVGDAHLLKLQHIGPDRRDLLFQRVLRRDVGLLHQLRIDFRQRLAVQLAVRRQRQRFEEQQVVGTM